MKALRIGVILGTVASAAMASLWLLDVVPGEQAAESLKRILGVVGVLTLALWAILLVAGRGRKAD
jgi:hypothetical protein